MTDEVSALMQKADDFLMARNLTEAASIYGRVIESATNTENLSLAYNNRGQTKYLCVDFNGAIEDYTKAIEIRKDQPIAYYNRGLVHYRMGRFQKGVKDFELALHYDPKFDDARTALNVANQSMSSKENESQ